MSSKLREAVESLLDLLDDFAVTEEIVSIAHENQCHRELLHTDKTLAVLQKAKAALAEPVKNCEVGTAEEQVERLFSGIDDRGVKIGLEYVREIVREVLTWGQAPYKKGETK